MGKNQGEVFYFLDWPPLRVDEEPSNSASYGIFLEKIIEPSKTRYTVRPLFTRYLDKFGLETHVFPPIFRESYKPHYRDGRLLGLIAWYHFKFGGEEVYQSFFLPFIFYKKDFNRPEKSYLGIFPLGGQVKDLLADRITWFLFPLYLRTEQGKVRRDSFPWPFIQKFSGKGVGGLYLWPLLGKSHEEGRYRYEFFLWPFFYERVAKLDTDNPVYSRGIFWPFYMYTKSKTLEDKLIFFTGYRRDTANNYYEQRWLWPLWLKGEGPQRTQRRFLPFYSYSRVLDEEKRWYLWPFLRKTKKPEGALTVERSQILYFFYWDETQRNTEGAESFKARLTHIWPLASFYDNGRDIYQVQIFSPLEVFFPRNRAVRDTYSALLAPIRYKREGDKVSLDLLWKFISIRGDKNSRSLKIWPLFRHEARAGGFIRFSFLHGLISGVKEGEKMKWSLFKNVFKSKENPK